jgi:hypothetical protein
MIPTTPHLFKFSQSGQVAHHRWPFLFFADWWNGWYTLALFASLRLSASNLLAFYPTSLGFRLKLINEFGV